MTVDWPGGFAREFTGRKLSYGRELTLPAPWRPGPRPRTVIMTRFRQRRDPGSGETLLVAAGIVAGLVAGAVVAQRLGGWRGISRRLRQGRGPILELLREAVSPELVARLASAGGLEALLGGAPSGARRGRQPRAYDPYLDEVEVDDMERAAAGMSDDDEELAEAGIDEEFDGDDEADDDEPDVVPVEVLERELLAAFRADRVLRRRPIEIACDDDGVVELRGTVHDASEARRARRLAAEVPGVTDVDADLRVRAPQAS